MKHRRYLIAQWVAVAVLLAAVNIGAVERPSLYGFAPAYPADTMPAFTADRNPPHTGYERWVRLLLTIGDNGAVRDVQPADSAGIRTRDYVAEYLTAIPFIPATMEGKAVRSVLPIDVVLAPKARRPDFVFPVDREQNMPDRLAWPDILAANDITMPSVRVFPSYFAELKWSDSSTHYPFVLARLDLDAAGQVVGIEAVRSTLNAGPHGILASALWADFEPLTVRGKPRASSCFLLVSFFPQIMYPTQPWTREEVDTLPPMEQARLQLFGDTTGLVLPPVIRRLRGNMAEVPGAPVYSDRDTVSAILAVDTLGLPRILRFDVGHGALSEAARMVSKDLSFYPAMDPGGRLRSFRGRVLLTGSPSGRIRMHYVW